MLERRSQLNPVFGGQDLGPPEGVNMPYSHVVLPPNPSLPLVRAIAAANVALGVAYTAWYSVGGRHGLDPFACAWVATTLAAVVWSGGVLRARGLQLEVRIKILLAGVSAIALWIPVALIASLLLVFAMYGFYLFFLFVAPIPLILWGAICATWSLSRYAAALLFRLEEDDANSI
jgi:hypothetical protein